MLLALRHAKFSIRAIGLTYVLFVIIGAVMVHTGNRFALNYRDRLVHSASGTGTLRALDTGYRVRAALLDFGGNLLLGAVPQTISGLAVLPPFPIAAFRGWVGGIVSVDGNHHSRLADAHERNYYLFVLTLQLLPYSLTGGAGVHLGLAMYRNWRASVSQPSWKLPLPRAAVLDVLWIYALSIPLFLLASLVEFLAR
jgi:uncharacterized membrane protein SpoIIM required for sporulation